MEEGSSQTIDNSKEEMKGELIHFTINYKKQNFAIEFGSENTLSSLRIHIAKLTGVAAALQKLMLKGMVKDDTKTLNELGLKEGAKLMLVGSTINDVMAASAPPPTTTEAKAEETKVEALCDQMPHKKFIEKGPPEGSEPGKKGKHEPLPQNSIEGIYNNIGTKVRLTFKVWVQELWIQSASSTQKVPFASIRSVSSEPIKGKEEYHILILQLGGSDKSKYFLYFVPCQYIRAIKTTILSDYAT